jgi:hypothetical protein
MSVLCIAALFVAGGCTVQAKAGQETVVVKEKPSRLEPIEGSELHRVILTDTAARRLELQTQPIHTDVAEGVARTLVPYAAILYDVQGEAWVYTNPAPLTFVRARIDVDTVDGDMAVLLDGPPAGTAVVIVGGAELYGAEFEFQEG